MEKLTGIAERPDRKSLPDRIVETLRRSIISGSLPSGTRLLETGLAQELDVSRGALREALRTLQLEGLVESRHNRGSFVAQISEQDIREIYSLRSLLEGLAVRRVTEQATPDQVQALQRLVDEMIETARAGDERHTNDLDLQLHKTIWEMSGHQRLCQILSSMQSQIRMFLSVNTQLYEELVDYISDHQQIVDAIRSRNADEAERIMKYHIESSGNTILDYVHRTRGSGNGQEGR